VAPVGEIAALGAAALRTEQDVTMQRKYGPKRDGSYRVIIPSLSSGPSRDHECCPILCYYRSAYILEEEK